MSDLLGGMMQAPDPDDEPARTALPARTKVMAGVALAVVCLGGGYLFLGSSGDGGSGASASAVPSTTQHRARPATATPSATPVATAGVAAASVRNPFLALVKDTAAAAADGSAPATPAASGSPTPSASVPATSTTTVPSTPTARATPTTPATTPATPAPGGTYALTFVGLQTTGGDFIVTWKVAGKTVVTLNNQRFGLTGELQLLSVTKGDTGVMSAWVQAGADRPVEILHGHTVQVP